MNYKPLFPWFGGKSRVSDVVWERFGNVPNYVEPFFGSGAVMFMRPHAPKVETINDLDGYVCNFWRSVKISPDSVIEHADYPISEIDLHSRHDWLVDRKLGFTDWLREDPSNHDPQVAGWWVWGACQWIGGGWCDDKGATKSQRTHLSTAGMGVHAPTGKKRPHLGNAGRGVHAPTSRQIPHVGDGGRGVHAPTSRQIPHVGDGGMGVHAGRLDLINKFSDRLRNVRVCCGDWHRVLGKTPTIKNGLTGVFLDPPYTNLAGRAKNLYAEDSLSVGHDVCAWAIENGCNPKLRIAVCGYQGEHDFPDNWECVPWKAAGGYASQGKGDNANSRRERIWFSPHCLEPEKQMSLFG